MRVRFSCDIKLQSGKEKFAFRLSEQFKKLGIKIVSKNPDVNLVFVKGVYSGKIYIIRLDNAWINLKINSGGKNKKIYKTMKKCDAVIYQGEYSKKVCQKFIGIHKINTVIPNGCDFSEFKETYVHRRPYVLAFSRWRPHKRLKEITNGFLESGLNKDYDLIICGDPDYVVKDKSVIYVGKTNKKILNPIIKGCKFVIHLAYMDCCPNSVVESLVCGKNILHTDSGGMKDIVKCSGYCIKDGDFNYKMVDLYNPPALDMNSIIKGYQTLVDRPGYPRKDLFIEEIAKLYIAFFKKVIRLKRKSL